MLIIIHLPSNYTPGRSGHQSRLLFSASTAGLPAGAAGLSDREVTTRGQPHVIFSHINTGAEEEEEEEEEEKSLHPGRGESLLADLLCHSFRFIIFIYYTCSILMSVLNGNVFYSVDNFFFPSLCD